MSRALRGQRRQRLGRRQFAYGDVGGDRNTIHGTGHLDVEVDTDGKVVAVWFRCLMVPFEVHEADAERADAMRSAQTGLPAIQAIVIEDPRAAMNDRRS